MTEFGYEAERDTSRFQEGVDGATSIPSGTTLHILGDFPLGRPEQDWVRDEVAKAWRAQESAGMSSSYCLTLPWERHPFSIPRGISWTRFPVLLEPRYGVTSDALLHDAVQGSLVRPSKVRSGAALTQCSAVFLHPALEWSTHMRENAMLALSEILDAAGAKNVFVVEDDRVVSMSPGALVSGMMAARIRRRFEYNYSLNFKAIAGKSLVHALSETLDDVSDEVEVRGTIRAKYSPREMRRMALNHIVAGEYRGFDAPILLQALFRVRRHGEIRLIARVDEDVPALFRRDDAGYLWDGLGQHPAARLTKEQFLEFSLSYGYSHMLDKRGDGDAVNRVLRLNSAAEMFLDMLHPDAEDPNMPCRWAGRDLDEGDEAAMDRWIVKTFGKIKNRVNGMGLGDEKGARV